MLFEDEASLSNTATVGHTWSPRRQQPVVVQPQRSQERKTIFGAVNPRSGQLITQVADRGNTRTFFRFLCRVLQAHPHQKVYMVLDNVNFHHAKRLASILERYEDRIALIFLPPYSPDLNPIERVWWLMRKQVTHHRWLKDMDERVAEFEDWCLRTPPEKLKTICNLIENIY